MRLISSSREYALVGDTFETTRGFDEQDMLVAFSLRFCPGFARFVENQNSGRNRRAEEEFLRQPDDGLQDVFIDELAADDAFGCHRGIVRHAGR